MEVGPWRIDGNGGLKTVQGGWEEYTTMVYGAKPHTLASVLPGAHSLTVDQPAGTGLSYTSTNHYVHTLQEVRFLVRHVVLACP